MPERVNLFSFQNTLIFLRHVKKGKHHRAFPCVAKVRFILSGLEYISFREGRSSAMRHLFSLRIALIHHMGKRI